MNADELERRIAGFPYWYHRIELTDGVVTPGWAPIDAASYRIPDDLSGKRVLDIGAWDGYWSFEALKRGAVQVVAIDDFSDYVGHLETEDRKAWETFDLCREALGYDEQQCQRQQRRNRQYSAHVHAKQARRHSCFPSILIVTFFT